jgi:hypothetical protein
VSLPQLLRDVCLRHVTWHNVGMAYRGNIPSMFETRSTWRGRSSFVSRNFLRTGLTRGVEETPIEERPRNNLPGGTCVGDCYKSPGLLFAAIMLCYLQAYRVLLTALGARNQHMLPGLRICSNQEDLQTLDQVSPRLKQHPARACFQYGTISAMTRGWW